MTTTRRGEGEGRGGEREQEVGGGRERLLMRSEPETNQHNLLNKIRKSGSAQRQRQAEGGEHSAQDRSSPTHTCSLPSSFRHTPAATPHRPLPPDTGGETPARLGGPKGGGMQPAAKEDREPPKVEASEDTPVSASAETPDTPSSQDAGAQAEHAGATLTPRPGRGCRSLCQPWCLLLVLTLLLLSLLGSWAVVHLSLGTQGGSPFQVSASYNERVPQDDTATIEPHFTTNCTMGKFYYSSLKRLSSRRRRFCFC